MKAFGNNDDDQLQCLANASGACSFRIEYPLTSAIYYVAITSECGYTVTAYWVNRNCSQPVPATPSLTPVPAEASSNKSISETNATGTTTALTTTVKPPAPPAPCPEVSRPTETFRFIGPAFFRQVLLQLQLQPE